MKEEIALFEAMTFSAKTQYLMQPLKMQPTISKEKTTNNEHGDGQETKMMLA